MTMRRQKWKSAAAKRICRFAGVAHVEEAVVEIARRLLDGVRTRPTDLDAIFPRVGIAACVIDSTMLISGELRAGEDGLLIACSPHEPPMRRRFTIAHEIGHAVFERTGPYVPHHGKELEKICDKIASEILVPQNELRAAIHAPITMREVSRIAKLFEASITMTAIRCAELFDITVCQFDDGDISWMFSPQGVSRHALQLHFVQLAKEHASTDRGEVECESILGPGKQRTCFFQWRSTGRYGRKLLLLSSQSDCPALPDPNWEPEPLGHDGERLLQHPHGAQRSR